MSPLFKLLRLTLFLVAMLNLNQAQAGYYFTYDGLWYDPISDNTAETYYGGGGYGHYSGDKTIHATAKTDSYSYTVVGIGYSMFRDCFDLTSVSIPGTVTYIEARAFEGCSSLKNVNIPSGVTRIENYTFSACNNLSSEIAIPNATYIGDYAFASCSSIPSVKLGDNVNYIGIYAFHGCKSLTEFIIPSNVTKINQSTFASCDNLKNITLHNRIDSIHAEAFSACTSLETISIPNSVKSIGTNAFNGCSSLKNINLPYGIHEISYGLFRYCTSLTDIAIPSSVTSIRPYSFSGCSSLQSIDIPYSVTSIKDHAFYNCSNLQSIKIPDNVHTLESRTFDGCTSLETVYLGKKISSIGNHAFAYCSALKEIHIANPIPPTVDNITYGINDLSKKTLYVPCGSATAYRNHSYWKKYNIVEDAPIVNENIRSVYAYDLNLEGNNGQYTLIFKVTGNAEANVILTDTKNGDEIVIEIGSVTKGENSIEINADDYGSDKQFNWAIEVNSPTIKESSIIFDAKTAGRAISSNSHGGVTFISNTESNAFGKIVVSNGFSQGIDIYSADLQLESSIEFPGDTTHSASSYRCAENNGIVYLADWSTTNSGLYTFDPTNPTPPVQWFAGTRNTEGIFTNAEGNIIGGSITGIDFLNNDDDTQLFLFCKGYPTSSEKTLVRYDLGDATSWANVPNATYPNVSGLLINGNVEIITTPNGFFASQVRYTGNNVKSVPAFIYANYNDSILYNSGTTGIVNGCGGGIAINNDATLFAIATPNEGIVIFNLSWENDGTPIFSKLYTLPSSISSNSTGELPQLEFDIAGNLHAYLRNDGYRVYALPQEAPKAVTAAKKSLLIESSTTGIINATDDANTNISPIKYYNLQGMEIEKPANGIFIKRQGNNATKVKIK